MRSRPPPRWSRRRSCTCSWSPRHGQAAKVVKRTVEATTDEIASELQEALKS